MRLLQKIVDDMEKLATQLSHLIQFIWFRCKGIFKSFPMIKYTYVSCLAVAMWFFFYFIWFYCFFMATGLKRIQNPVKHLRWSF